MTRTAGAYAKGNEPKRYQVSVTKSQAQLLMTILMAVEVHHLVNLQDPGKDHKISFEWMGIEERFDMDQLLLIFDQS